MNGLDEMSKDSLEDIPQIQAQVLGIKPIRLNILLNKSVDPVNITVYINNLPYELKPKDEAGNFPILNKPDSLKAIEAARKFADSYKFNLESSNKNQ